MGWKWCLLNFPRFATFAPSMKQCAHILLSLLIATTSAPSGQGMASVLKFSAFAHHFMHHVFCHGEELGVKEFVSLHYSEGEHHEQDLKEHENLPFQHHSHHDSISSQVVLFFSAHSFGLNILTHSFLPRVFLYKEYHLSHHFSFIWKPPKALV